MSDQSEIRDLFFRKGLKPAQIARKVGHDRRTVTKYLDQENWQVHRPQAPKVKPSILDPYKPQIDEWLLNDMTVRRKQRHTAKRIYSRLQEINGSFDVSYRTVASYVKSRKAQLYDDNECFLPLEHPAGEAQVDFGEADFYERGVLIHGYYLTVSYPYSNGGYTQLFKGANLECLLEGLKNIFAYAGGVPRRIWLDNLSPVVAKILKAGERKLTDGFLRFKEHYRLSLAFCNPDAGHEKGNVENKVGYHRRNLLVPPPQFDDLRQFNETLLVLADRDMARPHYRKETQIKELFEDDKKAFGPLPEYDYEVFRLVSAKTDSYAKFTLDGRYSYSTAPQYARQEVLVKLTAYDVTVLDKSGRNIITHPRLYGEHKQEAMNWLPYLTQLSQRPAALKYSGVYVMLPEEIQAFLETCSRSEQKDVLCVLAAITKQSGFTHAVDALKQAMNRGVKDPDSVMALFRRIAEPQFDFSDFQLGSTVPALNQLKPDISAYARFIPDQGGKMN